jgi:hypothetical protein
MPKGDQSDKSLNSASYGLFQSYRCTITYSILPMADKQGVKKELHFLKGFFKKNHKKRLNEEPLVGFGKRKESQQLIRQIR